MNYTTTFDTAHNSVYFVSTAADHCRIVVDYDRNRIYLHYAGNVERLDADSVLAKDFDGMCRRFFDDAERFFGGQKKMITNDFIKAVRDEANAIIEERKADGLEPLTATAREVSARMRANYLDVVFAFGALHAYGVATCGNTINDYFFKRNK